MLRPSRRAAARGSDLKLTPSWIDPVLYAILHTENAFVMHGMKFPWGSSVYAVARKP